MEISRVSEILGYIVNILAVMQEDLTKQCIKLLSDRTIVYFQNTVFDCSLSLFHALIDQKIRVINLAFYSVSHST